MLMNRFHSLNNPNTLHDLFLHFFNVGLPKKDTFFDPIVYISVFNIHITNYNPFHISDPSHEGIAGNNLGSAI